MCTYLYVCMLISIKNILAFFLGVKEFFKLNLLPYYKKFMNIILNLYLINTRICV